jgi:allophanate hydrolase
VALADGRVVAGFLCEPVATEDALDITPFGGWRDWLAGAAAEVTALVPQSMA